MTAAGRAGLLRDANFAWLMGGGVIAALGDQFSMIALPWLVLKLSGDPVALGLVVALMGIPRAVLILFGGAGLCLAGAALLAWLFTPMRALDDAPAPAPR